MAKEDKKINNYVHEELNLISKLGKMIERAQAYGEKEIPTKKLRKMVVDSSEVHPFENMGGDGI